MRSGEVRRAGGLEVESANSGTVHHDQNARGGATHCRQETVFHRIERQRFRRQLSIRFSSLRRDEKFNSTRCEVDESFFLVIFLFS